ncbi:MAG: hypothetical protein JSW04_09280, partial [Desulfobacterales bacterium]
SEIILLEILVFISALAITGIFFLFGDTSKYDIILRANEIEGPIRLKYRDNRISVPYEDIDLDGSRKQSFLRRGYVATKNSNGIWISNLYFSINQTNRLFEELSIRIGEAAKRDFKDVHK